MSDFFDFQRSIAVPLLVFGALVITGCVGSPNPAPAQPDTSIETSHVPTPNTLADSTISQSQTCSTENRDSNPTATKSPPPRVNNATVGKKDENMSSSLKRALSRRGEEENITVRVRAKPGRVEEAVRSAEARNGTVDSRHGNEFLSMMPVKEVEGLARDSSIDQVRLPVPLYAGPVTLSPTPHNGSSC